jgi:hypothetical protein
LRPGLAARFGWLAASQRADAMARRVRLPVSVHRPPAGSVH